MWQRDVIPGFSEALESERVDRSLAFAWPTELIKLADGSDLYCETLTPYRYEWLSATGSPFITSGVPSYAHCQMFLWIMNKAFVAGESKEAVKKRLEFWNTLPQLSDDEKEREEEIKDLIDEIDDILDRAFLDAPQGRSTMPYYSFTADIVVAMSSEPFRWDMERTLDTDLRRIFQLLKVRTHANKGTVVNRRSGQLVSDWLADLNVVTRDTKEDVERLIIEMAKEGWIQASDISPNTQCVKVGNDWTVDTSKAATWSVAMRKGADGGNE